MNDAARRRLLDRLRPNLSRTGGVRRLLATTHNLEKDFFDAEFLCTSLSIAQAELRNHSGRLALQRKLAELEYSGVLCEARAYVDRPSLRTVVHPVSLRGACLHAKLVVIQYEHAVRILVGSANLTEHGYRRNREVSGELLAYRDDPKQAAEGAAILRSAHETLGAFSDRATEFLDALDAVRVELDAWAGSQAGAESPVVWSDAARPLWQALLERWPRGQRVHRLRIVSPFWCEDGSADTPLRRLLRELRERDVLDARCNVELYVESVPLAGGGFDVKDRNLAVYLPDFPGVSVRALPVDPTVDPNDLDVKLELTATRPLHAKILVLESRERALAYAGSANFTRNGFALRHAPASGQARANVEAGWVFELPPRAVPGLLPKKANDGHDVVLVTEPRATLVDPDEPAPAFWPDSLLGAELAPSASSDALELVTRWDAHTPPGWTVCAPRRVDGEARDADSGSVLHTTAGGAATVRTALSAKALEAILRDRHVLVVTSPSDEASYPVNVAAGEARHRLPLSAGTKPRENDLLLYYQGRITFEDLYPDPGDDPAAPRPTAEAAKRPTSGVDTSRIQAYRIRAFVDALPGIERELLAARGSEGVLWQAFLGEVSPVALARHVEEQVAAKTRSPTAAAFQLAELAALLRSVRAKAPEGVEHFTAICDRARRDIEGRLEKLRAAHAELRESSHFAVYVRRLEELAR